MGVATGGSKGAGGGTGVGGTRVGAADPSDQSGVAGGARRGRRAGSVGRIIRPPGRTTALGNDLLRS